MGTPERVAALSEQLIRVHESLRERLMTLRDAPEDLPSHCVAFCAAIQTHHTGEDSQLLPALRAAAPELAPVIDKLIEDHELVAGILRRIRELHGEPGAVERELDGLAAILESHFSFEERRIAKALDTLGPDAWSADVFAPDPGTSER